MDPLSNQLFSHDYVKYVLQAPDTHSVNQGVPPLKPFEIKSPEKTKKSKKDIKKRKEKG